MNEEQRKKYEQLKKQNKTAENERRWDKNILLQECPSALGKQAKVIPSEKHAEVIKKINIATSSFKENGSLTCSGEFTFLNSINEIATDWLGERVLIIWDEATLPIVNSDLFLIKQNIEDVKAVAFDTWLVAEQSNRLVEINHDGVIRQYLV